MGLLDKLFGKKEEVESITEFETPQDPNAKFSMIVQDVFTITGRGTVVVGKIDSGTINIGDEILINGILKTTVTGIEMFRETLNSAKAGDNVGLLLNNVARQDINKSDVLTK